jgi:hypothetical protein
LDKIGPRWAVETSEEIMSEGRGMAADLRLARW